MLPDQKENQMKMIIFTYRFASFTDLNTGLAIGSHHYQYSILPNALNLPGK